MPADEIARRAHVLLFDRWAAGDADGYASLFAEDAHYIAFDGVDQHGRQAIADAHRPLFERWARGSTLTGEIAAARTLCDGVVLAHAWGAILDRGRRRPKAKRLSTQTLLLQREGAEWWYAAFHNTRVRPVVPGGRRATAFLVADAVWSLVAPDPRPADTGMPGAAGRAVT